MEIFLKKDEHFSFSNQGENLDINVEGIKIIINDIFRDKSFTEKLFAREFAAQTIDVFLNNDITRKIMFEAIKGNSEYKEQMTKILSEKD